MALNEDAAEKTEAASKVSSFIKDHFYGTRLKRTALSYMIHRK